MPDNQNRLSELEDCDDNEFENSADSAFDSAFEHSLEKRDQNARKVDIRRLIEARHEMATLVDDISFYRKLDLDLDSQSL